ncbi:MAG: hypothetical protein IJ646_10440, partial [Clostridia bacterium]|nr:hypothetical protein [Clostridia bacterium]
MDTRTLLRYELKKTFGQRAYWMALAVMVLLLVANELIPIYTGNYLPKLRREVALSGTAVDDAVIEAIQAAPDQHAYDPIYSLIKYATGRTDITGVTAASLYRTREEVNDGLMTEDHVTDAERAYWKARDSANATPFVYRYDGAYAAFFEVVYFMDFMVLILCGVSLSGLFADERARGTDQIVFGTRHGRARLFRVKVVVGVAVGLVSALLLIGEEVAACFLLYGTDGADAMVQIHIPQCMMRVTMGQAMLYMSLLIVAASVFLAVVAMFLSQITMNHAGTMAGMILVMFLSMVNLPGRPLKLLTSLMPGAFVGSWLFDNYITVTLFGARLTVMQYAPLCWA